MKNNIILFIITLLAITGCSEQPQTTKNAGEKDSTSIMYNGKGNADSNSTDDLMRSEEESDELPEDGLRISDLFSREELDKIRYNFIRQLRFEFSFFDLSQDLTLIPSEDWGERNVHSLKLEITDKEKSENMDVIYRIFVKKNPTFKPVSNDLFEEKMKKVFGIDVNDKSVCNSSFYTNHSMHEESAYTTYIDLKNHIITLGTLPLSFEKDMDWDELHKKLENIDQESIAYYDTKERLYDEYLDEALQKKYLMYCSKQKLEYLFHVNNYVFYDSQASLSWLLNNIPENTNTPFPTILFEFFNYDEEPRIIEDNYKFNISKGFPLNANAYDHIFGEVENCSQIQYYNHFKFKVRTRVMQYVVDNCYDETDLDQYGIKNDKNICVMEDCFDYLFGYVLKGDEYKESEVCHYYQVCAYLAYYLQKAYDKYVSYGKGNPRCWHNALVNNLRSDIENNDSRFEKYVKANDYFQLEGFEQIMQEAHKLALER